MHISIDCRKKKGKQGSHIELGLSVVIHCIVNNYWEERRIKLLINVHI